MKWPRILFLILLTGCTATLKVEPLPKKTVHKYYRHHKSHSPRVTPTPTPAVSPDRPLQLEHTGEPTPAIKIPPTAFCNISTDPMI